MEIFLNGSSKETLFEKQRPKTTVSYFLEINDSGILCPYNYEMNCFWASSSTYSNIRQLAQKDLVSSKSELMMPQDYRVNTFFWYLFKEKRLVGTSSACFYFF